ncbi:MAG: nitroreductase family protein [Ardenticatenaceae bacterium]|nr:nitroreductase family protein [Ardenticatenaceae bacterium]
MNFFEVVEKRHSIRAFATEPVEPEKLQQILETANRAPSAGNLQGYEIFVVKDAETRAALAKAALEQGFIAEAPVVLVFCTNAARSAQKYGRRGETLYTIQDATIACTFAMLAVTAVNLSSVWVGAFNTEAVQEIIGAPSGIVPVAILPIGYAAVEPRLTPRRELADIVHTI